MSFRDSFLAYAWVFWVCIEVYNDFVTLDPNTRIPIYNICKNNCLQHSTNFHSTCHPCMFRLHLVDHHVSLALLDKIKKQLLWSFELVISRLFRNFSKYQTKAPVSWIVTFRLKTTSSRIVQNLSLRLRKIFNHFLWSS